MSCWRHLLLAILAAGAAPAASAAPKTHVLVVASLHGFHRQDPNYSYDRLYQIVREFRPDIVGVELRPEDTRADSTYLKKSYPLEMVELRDRYARRAVGFDWLGDDIAGRAIPDDYWTKGSKPKILEREMAADKSMASAEDDRLDKAETALIGDVTPAALVDGRYYALVKQRHALAERLTKDTRYAPVAAFTSARDRHIDANLVWIVQHNPGRRIVFVMGADHYGFAVDALRRAFGRRIDLQLPK